MKEKTNEENYEQDYENEENIEENENKKEKSKINKKKENTPSLSPNVQNTNYSSIPEHKQDTNYNSISENEQNAKTSMPESNRSVEIKIEKEANKIQELSIIPIKKFRPAFISPRHLSIQIDSTIFKINKAEIKPNSRLKLSFLTPPKIPISVDSTIHFKPSNNESSNNIIKINLQKPNFILPPTLSAYIDGDILIPEFSKNIRPTNPQTSSILANNTSNLESAPISNSNNPDIDETDLEFIDKLNDILNSISSRGPTVIVYDEYKAGIEYSLARIAVEIAEIKSRQFNSKLISSGLSPTDSNLIKLKEIADGIFILDRELCEEIKNTKDNPVDNLLNIAFTSLIGDKLTIIIMPKCIYEKYQLKIAQKPAKIIFEKFTKADIQTLAYLASGLTSVSNLSYGSLPDVNGYYISILEKSWKWLREKYSYLDIPSNEESEESDTHRQLKAVTIKHLVENKKIDPNSIQVEEERGGGLIPDIYVSTTNEIYDAKTSYGKLPADELYELQKKYSTISPNIFAVMRPLPGLLDFKAIRGKIKSAKEKGINLSVLIPVEENNKVELVDLFTFIKKGKKYYENLRKIASRNSEEKYQ
ncbi:hypothetical protein [Acidianus manzaensis]|uniref:Uncharacterized protein n=1 Tax=Acidianus manzaensis TaxID=282676 RepID=A0A1W6K328_9CREN|nr:hypothetical protein [Acidianus manzaensis]ARM76961.1 hypothetical protein B6F84_13670 [Acidianus manzaensis]